MARAKQELPPGMFPSVNFRVPVDEYLAFLEVVSRDFEHSRSKAGRAALRLLVEQHQNEQPAQKAS